MTEIEDIFRRVLDSAYGIVIAAPDDHAARQLRRRLYAVRERARRANNTDLDLVSVIVRSDGSGDVWLVRRDRITHPQVPDLPSRPITAAEMPAKIRARGRSRLSNLSLLSIS